jgi:hypothetical protein
VKLSVKEMSVFGERNKRGAGETGEARDGSGWQPISGTAVENLGKDDP